MRVIITLNTTVFRLRIMTFPRIFCGFSLQKDDQLIQGGETTPRSCVWVFQAKTPGRFAFAVYPEAHQVNGVR